MAIEALGECKDRKEITLQAAIDLMSSFPDSSASGVVGICQILLSKNFGRQDYLCRFPDSGDQCPVSKKIAQERQFSDSGPGIVPRTVVTSE